MLDRDAKFSAHFRGILKAAGVQVVHTAVRAPNMNAFAERFVLSIKRECLSRMIFFGEGILRGALMSFAAHYHHERNHQGRDNEILQPESGTVESDGPVMRRERLGGLLSFYHRKKRTG